MGIRGKQRREGTKK